MAKRKTQAEVVAIAEAMPTALTGKIDFFGAVEIVAKTNEIDMKAAEVWLKEKLNEGTLSMVDGEGIHLTPTQFAERLAALS
jgi:hypothetical protein